MNWLKEHDVDVVLAGLQYMRPLSQDDHYYAVREILREVAAKENVMVIRRYEAMQFMAAAHPADGGFGPDEFERTEAGYNCLAQYLASAITLGAFGKGTSSRPLRGQPGAAGATATVAATAAAERGPSQSVVGRHHFERSLAVAALAMAPGARADAVAVFYKGKDLRMIVSTTVGHRLRHLCPGGRAAPDRHIPSNPTILVQNMPGAGGIMAANHIFFGRRPGTAPFRHDPEHRAVRAADRECLRALRPDEDELARHADHRSRASTSSTTPPRCGR